MVQMAFITLLCLLPDKNGNSSLDNAETRIVIGCVFANEYKGGSCPTSRPCIMTAVRPILGTPAREKFRMGRAERNPSSLQ